MMEINQTQVSGVDSFKLKQKLNSPAASEEMEKLCFSDSDEDQQNSINTSSFKNITASENTSKSYSNGVVEAAQLNGKTEVIKDNLNGLDEISEDSLGDDITLKVNYEDDDPVDEMMEDELLDEKHNIKKDLISNGENSMKDKNSDKEIADINKNKDKINNYLEDISSNSSEMEESQISELTATKKDLSEKEVVSNDSEKNIDENILKINNKKNDDSVENDVEFIKKSNNDEKNIDSDDAAVNTSINNQISDKISDNKCDKIEKNEQIINESEKKSDDIDKLLSEIDNVIEYDPKKDSNSIITVTNADDIISLDDDDDEKDLNLESQNKEENNSLSTIAENKKTESIKINDTNKDDRDDEVVVLASPKTTSENGKMENNKSCLIDDDDDEEIVFIECIKDNKPEINNLEGDNGDLSDDDIIFFEDDSLTKNSESDKTKLNKINETESIEKTDKSNTIEKNGEKPANEIVVLEKDVSVKDDEDKDKEKIIETEEQVENEKTKKVTENIEQKEDEKPSEEVSEDESCKKIVSEQITTNDKELDVEKSIQKLEVPSGNIQKLDNKILEDDIIVLDTSIEEIKNNTEIEKDVNTDVDGNETISPIEVNTIEKEEKLVENSKEEIVEKSKVDILEKPSEEVVDKSKEKCVEKSTEECVEKLQECGSKSEEILEKMDISESVLDTTTIQKSAENLVTDDVNIINNGEKELDSSDIKILEDVLISDNSDNARDIFAEKQTDETKEKSEKLLELNNSKSNQQTENQDGKDKILEEIVDEEPAQKKVKFSDGVSLDEKSSNSTDSTKQTTTEEISKKLNDDDEDIVLIDEENTTLQKTSTDSTKTLKRTLSQENLTNATKKLKVDSGKPNEIIRYESTKIESQISKIPEQPHLYPAPKLPTNSTDIKLDFMKRFKRSINSMTKKDLEELVMQKIVESIIHTSEFGELRDIIEKQEQIIEQHRKKVTELTKQFKDLEMVHNRVLKDLETRNQQFIMPVKITRAVGLQVVIPSKVPTRPIPSTFSPGQQPTRDRDILTNQHLQRSTSIPGTPGINNSNISPDSKRGRSHQKFTPLRPDTPQNSPLNRSTNTSTPIGNTSSPVVPTNLSQKINAQNLTPQQQHQIKMQQQKTQQHMQQVLAQKQLQQAQQQAALKRAALQQNSNGMVQFPQTSIGTSTSPSLANTMCVRKLTGGPVRTPSNVVVKKSTTQIRPSPQQDNRTSPMMAKQQQQSSTNNSDPAKPTKSFIDLTDEDEQLQLQQQQAKSIGNVSSQQNQQLPALVAIPTTNQQNSRISTYVVNNKANVAHQQQRSTAPVNNRVQGTNNNRQQQNLVTIQRQLPSSTTATRIVTSQQRQQQQITVRYTHPAPLPRAPPLLSNPSWKETPPRPAIHISNIETGIVISWTMDDMAERHAEVTSYQIYAYQETAAAPQVDAWRHVGDVKAMLLPMAVTLTQFQEGQRYFFAVRAVDIHNRCGNFSPPKTWA